MKKIISILLMLCIALTLCASLTGCDMETVTPYTRLRDFLLTQKGEGIVLVDKESSMNITLQRKLLDGSGNTGATEQINVTADAVSKQNNSVLIYRIEFAILPDSDTYHLTYSFINGNNNQVMLGGKALIKAHDYTGNELVSFTSVTDMHTSYEHGHRENVTAIMNSILKALDTYFKDLDMSVTDLGFVNLSAKYLAADRNEAVAEEDLGGLFSLPRLAYAGKMLVLGVGMVFLVLAILWVVLAIFAAFAKSKEKKNKATPKEAPAENLPMAAPAAAPAVASDDAIVAAITAAIAMAIQSDPNLSSQFADGFRVVSFKKKSGKASWNH